jgi:hypothetical protein
VKSAAATKADLDVLTKAVSDNKTLAEETKTAVKNIKVVNVTRQGVIEREIKTDVRYLNDCLPPAGVVRWNDVSAGRPVLPSGGSGQQPEGSGGELPKGTGSADSGRQSGNPLAKPR